MATTQSNNSVEASLKSIDTEEFIDIHFYRPIGYQCALFFHRLEITPNMVTIASLFIGLLAGIAFGFEDLAINIGGMLLLIWANIYDSTDGQLARMTGQKSELGRVLDGIAGDVWFISIYAAICIRLTPDWGVWIWVLGAVTGWFHSKQASMADYYRNIHLYFLKGKKGSELDRSTLLMDQYRGLAWSGNFWRKIILLFYRNYTKGQESTAKQFQKLFDTLQTQFGDEVPTNLRLSFCNDSRPLMKYTNMLSFNLRVIALFIALFLKQPYLYFLFELTVLNVILIYLVYTHEKRCKQLYQELTTK